MRLYLYRVGRTRAYSVFEQGTFYQVSQEEMASYTDRYYEEEVSLLCPFHALSFDEKTFQLVEGGEHYDGVTLRQSLLTTAEAAIFLDLSVRRVQALIQNKQLPAKQSGRDLFVSGPALIEFAQKERPAHRPAQI